MNPQGYYGRSYGPQFIIGSPLTPVVKRLLIANIACFVLQNLTGHKLDHIFGLVPGLVLSRLFVWQFATYMFLHGGLFHLLFNMFILYMFGRDIEGAMGSRSFTVFYFFCGIGAGLCSFIFYPPTSLVVGASGAIFGLFVAFAMLFPDRVVTLLLFFVLPVHMKAKHLVIILAGVEILFVINNSSSNFIAHFAHLGGAACGYIYMKNFGNVRYWLDPRKFQRPVIKVYREEENNAEFRERIDLILEKISRYGLSSLSENEKEFLRRAKDKY